MLHIILLLLKIIGIILLLILALILLILGIVLFSPITYDASGSFYGKPDVSARIRWLFIVLKADIDYHDGKLDVVAKVLHKTIMNRHSKEPAEEISDTDEEIQEEKAEKDSETDQPSVIEETEDTAEDQTVAEDETAVEDVSETSDAAGADKTASDESAEPASADEPSSGAGQTDQGTTLKETDESTDKISEDLNNGQMSDSFDDEQMPDIDRKLADTPQTDQTEGIEKVPGRVQRIIGKIKGIIKKITDKKKNEQSEKSAATTADKAETHTLTAEDKKARPSLGEKAGAAIDHVIDKLDDTADKIDTKLDGVEKKIDSLEEKAGFVDKLLQTEYIQQTIVFAGRMLKSIGKHILPRKLSGKIHFGLGDPATTGKILGYSSIFYPVYADTLELMPDFTRSVAEGELKVKGRIQIGILVIWIVKGLLNKNVRRSIKLALRIRKTKSFKEDILWQ